jgi:outer membrane protein assembly factor BamB
LKLDVGYSPYNVSAFGLSHPVKPLLYFGTQSKGLICVDAETGQIAWKYQEDAVQNIALRETDGMLFASTNTSIVAVNSAGQKSWSYDVNCFYASFQLIQQGQNTFILWQCQSNGQTQMNLIQTKV